MTIYYFAANLSVTPSDFIAFNLAYGALTGAIMQLAGVVTGLASVKSQLDMIAPILKATPEMSENQIFVKELTGNIDINNVSFKYDEEGALILNNISVSIKEGEYIAVVGTTGSGKSTLLRLLLGFEKPEAGAIYYDGQDISSIDIKSIRRKIGVVIQNGKLISGDILSNITASAPAATLEDAWNAAKAAGMDEDIRNMPMGMKTIISEGSGGLSGGQIQRIMIARAIISQPKIIFFDEATSALDNITQNIVAQSIEKLNATRIVIAHRLSTIIHCDRIVVLDKGEIVEIGTYLELINSNGLFSEMAKRQLI
ncbi:MAG: ATP-binding cassette domain-containing protein [Sporomusaceae bacterium]|nr:ATP-binding cassette domain-containing protein [Sporomusaceae bacterium]